MVCVSDLNAGLDGPSHAIDRETPRATMETLVYLARLNDWESAAHLLDLSDFSEAEQGATGAELAQKLETVISRKAVIDWDRLVDRPDGLDARASSDQAMAGEPRKSLLLWTLDLADHPAAIRLTRIKPDGGAPVWVFSQQTAGDIPALYQRYGPSRLEEMMPVALTHQTGFGLMWWEVIGLPILLGLALLAARLVWKAVDFARRKSTHPLTSSILKAIRGPAATAAATGLSLLVGASLFVFSGQISTVLTPLAWLGLLASALWLTVNAVEVVLDRLTDFDDTDLTQFQEEHMRTTATRVAAARRAFVVSVVLIGGGLFLTQTNIFQNLGFTLLGTAGALTLVLGFAARRVLGNIMASLQIALNQSAKIGDRIVYNDYLCHVERINFTYVQLRDWDGTRLVVPVEEFVSTPFENWTMKEPEMLRIIKIKFAHDADVARLRQVFDDVVAELDSEQLGDLDKVKVHVADQDVFGKDVWFALPCIDPNTSWDMACQAREKIIARSAWIAAEEDIEVFPQVNPAEAA
ncbi:mechanosensitive ion channel domain-containing protein [uncultured Roseobacter sp.]|uniref:mechanosensitive ion channel family protein n=1 Tax=uncultured Roseobacter sp. TaxID=114847 RepID=UPI002613BD08|nr:mechanosensitive ion channel domain-containing protein [uncultured Roseobacter sp.]